MFDHHMLVRDLDHGPVTTTSFGGQVRGGCRLGGLFAVEVGQRRGKVRRRRSPARRTNQNLRSSFRRGRSPMDAETLIGRVCGLG